MCCGGFTRPVLPPAVSQVPQIMSPKRERRVCELVEKLLYDIHRHLNDRRSSSYISSADEPVRTTAFENLNQNCLGLGLNDLRVEVAAVQNKIHQRGQQLARAVRRRDQLLIQRSGYCDVITAYIHAFSRKTKEEAKMRFSLTPGETGFSQWLDAMKMVAQLPGGMPPEFRTKLWLQLSEKHLQDKKIDWPRTEKIIFSEWSNPDDEELGVQIVKDLHRTGCSLFCGAQGEQNQALLKRVLLAYARWNKSVGYCQGFNMLGAIILQVMDRDEKNAVKVMIYLIDGVLPESYFANNLRGLSVDMAVFRDLMKLRLPKLSRHLEALQQDTSSGNSYEPPLTNVFTMQWFLTLFSNCLPQATVLRVWDLVFLHGNEVLLRTALAIWGILQDRVISVESADEFYCIMGVVTREMLEFGLMDANNLVKTIAMVDPFPNELQELRDKYLYNISPWTQSVQSAAKRGFRLFHSDNEDQDDTEDEATAKALAAAHGVFRRRESVSRDVATAGPTLDIGILKQQYAKLLQRQRQAHVIISAACSGTVGSPSVAVNHLLAGKSALVAKTRRIGPPEGAVPPPVTHQKPGKKLLPQKSGETLQWKDAPESKSEPRRNQDRVTETSVEESFRRKEQKQRSSSSSSSSTELCDDEFYKSDLDSEETSESSAKWDKETVAKLPASGEFDQQFSDSIRDVETLTENIAREDLDSIRQCALNVVDDIEERLESAMRLRSSFPVDRAINASEKSLVDEPLPFYTEIMPLTVVNHEILTHPENLQQDCLTVANFSAEHKFVQLPEGQELIETDIQDGVDEITRLQTRLTEISNNSKALIFDDSILSCRSTEINSCETIDGKTVTVIAETDGRDWDVGQKNPSEPEIVQIRDTKTDGPGVALIRTMCENEPVIQNDIDRFSLSKSESKPVVPEEQYDPMGEGRFGDENVISSSVMDQKCLLEKRTDKKEDGMSEGQEERLKNKRTELMHEELVQQEREQVRRKRLEELLELERKDETHGKLIEEDRTKERHEELVEKQRMKTKHEELLEKDEIEKAQDEPPENRRTEQMREEFVQQEKDDVPLEQQVRRKRLEELLELERKDEIHGKLLEEGRAKERHEELAEKQRIKTKHKELLEKDEMEKRTEEQSIRERREKRNEEFIKQERMNMRHEELLDQEKMKKAQDEPPESRRTEQMREEFVQQEKDDVPLEQQVRRKRLEELLERERMEEIHGKLIEEDRTKERHEELAERQRMKKKHDELIEKDGMEEDQSIQERVENRNDDFLKQDSMKKRHEEIKDHDRTEKTQDELLGNRRTVQMHEEFVQQEKEEVLLEQQRRRKRLEELLEMEKMDIMHREAKEQNREEEKREELIEKQRIKKKHEELLEKDGMEADQPIRERMEKRNEEFLKQEKMNRRHEELLDQDKMEKAQDELPENQRTEKMHEEFVQQERDDVLLEQQTRRKRLEELLERERMEEIHGKIIGEDRHEELAEKQRIKTKHEELLDKNEMEKRTEEQSIRERREKRNEEFIKQERMNMRHEELLDQDKMEKAQHEIPENRRTKQMHEEFVQQERDDVLVEQQVRRKRLEELLELERMDETHGKLIEEDRTKERHEELAEERRIKTKHEELLEKDEMEKRAEKLRIENRHKYLQAQQRLGNEANIVTEEQHEHHHTKMISKSSTEKNLVDEPKTEKTILHETSLLRNKPNTDPEKTTHFREPKQLTEKPHLEPNPKAASKPEPISITPEPEITNLREIDSHLDSKQINSSSDRKLYKTGKSENEPEVSKKKIDRNRRKTDVTEWQHPKKYNIDIVYENLPKRTDDKPPKNNDIVEKLALSKNEWETKMKRIAELDSATRAKISELNRRDSSSPRYRGRSISPSLSRPVVPERKKLKVSTLSFDEITSRTEKLLRDSECSTPLEPKIKTPVTCRDFSPSPVTRKYFTEDASPTYARAKDSTSKFKKLIEESYGPSEDEWLAFPKKFQAFSSPTSPEARFRTKIKYSEFVSPRKLDYLARPKELVDDVDEFITVTSYDSKDWENKFENFLKDSGKSSPRNEPDRLSYTVFEQKSTNSSPDRKRWDRKYLSSPEDFPTRRKTSPEFKKSTLSPESRHSSPRRSYGCSSPDDVSSSRRVFSPQNSFCPFPPRSPQRPKDIAVKLGLYPSSGEITSKNS